MRLRRPSPARSRRFGARPDPRYWWHHLAGTDYVPAVYASLSDAEWALVEAWFDETDRHEMVGEINVPAISLVHGIVEGGAVARFVQLGHYCGYSTLLIGFWLRRMGGDRRLVSVDIDAVATDVARSWVERAGLAGQVTLVTGDAGEAELHARVLELVGGPPEVVLIDTSHERAATTRELDLWIPSVVDQGLVLVHGSSVFGQGFDGTGEGGVAAAVDGWLADHPEIGYLNLNRHVAPDDDPARLVYKDGCGLGILQRSRPES